MTRTIIAIAMTISLISSTAAATETADEATDTATVEVAAAEDNTGVHTHDGFFLRLVGGSMALGMASERNDGSEMAIASAGGAFEASVGAIVAENLALHLDFLSADGEATWSESHDDVVFGRNQDVDLKGVGIGLTRYFEPSNVYISASVMSAWLSAPSVDEEKTVSMTTSYGGMLTLRAGKEWWVGDQWGLGIMGSIFAGAGIDEANDDETILGFGGATIGVSATFN